ncbi:hypothetical protein AnigIFM59636_009009 [Aspergillus niger]|uniref:Uncharacterized protein n=1 Tax=Aspergillus niger TaxID=5061 RepID=A0A505HJG2_ASPNG|nr:hypothetical protein CAN33_0037995 [Aspergillus niger]GKZ95270.1 hypothetical protein AnigIFM59636_009009 [Aspergillus niger]
MSIFSLCIALPKFKGATRPTPPLAMSLTTAFAGTPELYCSTYHIASPSTTALAAFSLLMYLHTNADGPSKPSAFATCPRTTDGTGDAHSRLDCPLAHEQRRLN